MRKEHRVLAHIPHTDYIRLLRHLAAQRSDLQMGVGGHPSLH